MTNPYDHHFPASSESTSAWLQAAQSAATAYLDGKPRQIGRHRITVGQRDAMFWSCVAWTEVPAEQWRSGVLPLALARYFAQEAVTNAALLVCIAAACPNVICQAVRWSGLVLRPATARRAELASLARLHSEVAELCEVLGIFRQAHQERVQDVEVLQGRLVSLTPFDMLIQASLYAFEHLVIPGMTSPKQSEATQQEHQAIWRTINDSLLWKLGTAPATSLVLDEAALQTSLMTHIAPVLQGSPSEQATRVDFAALLAAQIELNAFVSQSADAFSFDEAVRFVRNGQVLSIEEVNPSLRAAWWRDGRKLARLHEYWFYRALDEFERSGMAAQQIGRPENHEANQLAYVRAMRSQLKLTQVYGVANTVSNDAGEAVDLFQALLSLELTASFFQRDFLEVFVAHFQSSGDWKDALTRLVRDGLFQGQQNRLPLTWSGRTEKIANIRGWTVTPALPSGSAMMAGRILDFWTSDWAALAAQLRLADRTQPPELFERPFLRFGATLVQLPWLVGMQNNSTAAINNLRRLGQRRGEFREETQRIETMLGTALEARGFSVVLNWEPERLRHGDAGEVDVVCARDGLVFVMEVKSTFLRKSSKDAWVHSTSTLRRAGGQLQRKVAAVVREIALAGDLAEQLGVGPLAGSAPVEGWIVDTSIECDHERFGGFLKVSLEELLIALRDDHDLLHDPQGVFSGDVTAGLQPDERLTAAPSLYPKGFNAQRFAQVIAFAEVWAGI